MFYHLQSQLHEKINKDMLKLAIEQDEDGLAESLNPIFDRPDFFKTASISELKREIKYMEKQLKHLRKRKQRPVPKLEKESQF